jgi:Uncharacterized conserved protein (DUF2358)
MPDASDLMADADSINRIESVLQILRDDYARFPHHQTYSIYAEDVYFQDPLSRFRGVARYQQMIGLIQRWFLNCHMEVHGLQADGEGGVRSDWTLTWNSPLPWKPRIAISGWSELLIDDHGKIASHIDYWHCKPLDVLKQNFGL